MKKKVVSLILALAMLATSVCSVFAAEEGVDVSGADLKELVSFFAENTPTTQAKRLEILGYIQMYMGQTDRDMETLVNAVREKNYESLTGKSEDLKAIFDKVIESESYSTALFALEMIRAIPASTRKEVINGFGVKEEDKRASYEIVDISNEEAIDEALLRLYNDDNVYPSTLRTAMEEHVALDVSVAPYVVLNLFTAWKDTIQLTDDEANTGFAAYKVDEDYAERLLDNLGDYYTLGGKKIKDATQVAEFLAEVLNASYDANVIADMKTVLDDSGLDIYSPNVDAESITVNNKKIELSTTQSKAAKITINKSSFTVEGIAVDEDAEVAYAYVVSDKDPADWDWESSMKNESIKAGKKEKVAVRITNKGTEQIYYVTISRSDSDSGSNRNGSNGSSSIIITDDTIPAPPVTDAQFADTVNHWGRDYINAVVKKGLFIGYDDGNFYPDWGVTRQEMAVVLVRLLGIENELGSVTQTSYTDDSEIAAWAYDSVALLAAKGIYLGYDDGEFKPERVLTREEIVALAMRMYGYTTVDTTAPYSDVEQIGEWARKAVGQATSLGIISGRDDGLFAPGANVTRAEAAKILYNYMYIKGIY